MTLQSAANAQQDKHILLKAKVSKWVLQQQHLHYNITMKINIKSLQKPKQHTDLSVGADGQ